MLKGGLLVKVVRSSGKEEVIEKRPVKSFLGNFARYLYGNLAFVNPTLVDVGGNSFTLNVGGGPAASGAVIVLGTGTATPTPDDYTLTNLTKITTYGYRHDHDNYGDVILIGIRCAEVNETWGECGVLQTLYDTGGVARDTLLARDVFSTPISLSPGDVLCVVYRIVVAV